MTLVTEYSAWLIILCVALGAIYSLVLYYKDSVFDELSVWIKRAMSFFRFLAVSILAFLLLNPLLKTIFREVEKPIIIVAQDNSESLIIAGDSAYYKGEYRESLSNLIKELSDKYDVKTYSFGNKISDELNFDFNEKQTDISGLFDEIENRYSNRNVGAVLLASDGIYNKGSNPLYASGGLKAPVYTIALGDTAVKKDLIINRVAHNRLAYLGNDFPLEIWIDAKRCKGNRAQLKVLKDGQTLYSKSIVIDRSPFMQGEAVLIEARNTGIQKYTIKLTELEDEVSYENNVQHIYIDVLDDRQKILIVANSPHPDLAAMKNSIEANDNYEVEMFLADDFDKTLKKYNLVVLHQLPSSANEAIRLLGSIAEENIPVLHILGAQSSMGKFNKLQAGLAITGSKGKFNESQPVVDKVFALFNISDFARNAIRKFPPLLAPFGNYKKSKASVVLFNQKIGMIETEQPLLLFNTVGEKKTGVIAGEGIWRWRMHDYATHGSHQVFDELMSKIIQYLAVKEDKSRFRVTGENSFLENEIIFFDAELYNDNYELINEPDVHIEVINEEGSKFPFVFSKTSKAYRLNAGMLPVGEYSYVARVKTGEKVLLEKGEFSVSAIRLESLNTVADHGLLYNLALRHGGEMLMAGEMSKIPQILAAREDVKPVSHSQMRLKDLINLKWVFFLLFAFIAFEWFLRKRSGAY